MNQSEKILIDKIKQGDEKAFELVFKEYYAYLCSYARKFVNETEIAEEIVQDLFVKFWEHRQNYELKVSLKSYLFRAVRNNCIDYLKHEQIKSKYQNLETEKYKQQSITHTNSLEVKELHEKIEQAIENMPKQRKKIFKMNRFKGKKYREIAEELGISIKTVEAQMGSALKFLRNELQLYLKLILLLLVINTLWLFM